MPIYAYRCDSCGFENDHLQKLSDPALHLCPRCGQAAYSKQVTAAGFQLKGTGWYATDFKGGKPSVSTEKTEASEKSASSEETAASDKPAAATKTQAAEKAPASASGASACDGS